ncbi:MULTISPECIES: low molecular weight protein arginine phosphatase [Staphylococcus]|jgi:low molecular weight protein-tyrosine-phosphatase ptpB|uniref:low molecular weight protein arginine phosphatase n=1 Tax=Staphylococcus TaxID=1279 RepID=UPI0001EF4994|nr:MULTISPECIES: low molecular weight protein arginine phosphatase [Staphylococcus]EFS16850.1 phosphotyrosine protein phosphatase [Staphylococcus capitis C87]MBC3050230.1 low molecular weight protein arginine phosphatase [Staphylococcus capitis]MBC3070206.1 low molecular weight protein arginine phosphatase [Staphylococcus capitis]MBC3072392.1 low molecular weight protein arginine phosphatase [Staphylococcus capitis]MBC3083296.1 low molecular weight protein arginine phosphatase [Staphylococcus 
MKLIFVCTGNTCRSPLAESIAKKLMPNDDIQSRGLFAMEGQKISKESLQLIHSHHLPKPSNAQQFTLEDLEADLILTMSPSHKDLIKSQYGQYSNVYTINEYAGIEGHIEDPFGCSFEVYEKTFQNIYDLLKKIEMNR